MYTQTLNNGSYAQAASAPLPFAHSSNGQLLQHGQALQHGQQLQGSSVAQGIRAHDFKDSVPISFTDPAGANANLAAQNISSPLSLITHVSPQPLDVVIKGTVTLIKGITADLLAALAASGHSSSQGTSLFPSPANPSPTREINREKTEPQTGTGLKEFLLRELQPDSEGRLHEEQLQFGIAGFLLNKNSPELYKEFASRFTEYQSSAGPRASFEDGVKVALEHLVAAGRITRPEAESIAGISFRAAQLDQDLTSVFDAKGGGSDKTISVMSSQAAVAKAENTLKQISNGKLDAPVRKLDVPSNTVGTTASTTLSSEEKKASTQGFLWKPVSEADGKLVILLPENISTKAESVTLYRKDDHGRKRKIESGKYSGVANGNRAHFRFEKPGADYPDGVIVEIKLKGAKTLTRTIQNSASRLER